MDWNIVGAIGETLSAIAVFISPYPKNFAAVPRSCPNMLHSGTRPGPDMRAGYFVVNLPSDSNVQA